MITVLRHRVSNWSYLHAWWTRHAAAGLCFAVAFMAAGASVRLLNEFHRLLFDPQYYGAIDLRHRYEEISRWFAGMPVYTGFHHAGYPPASYVMLWPFLGWLSEWQARWLWGLITVLALVVLTAVAIRQSAADTRLHRLFIALIFVSTYPAPITIGNGQLGILTLTAMLCGLLLIRPERGPSWRDDMLATVLLLLAATKPSLTAPLFWVALFLPGRLRPMLLVGTSYVLLTLFAAAFQPGSLVKLFSDLARVSAMVMGSDPTPSLAAWMSLVGLQAWTLFASAVMLALCGVWVYLNRHGDFWMLVGASAIVARLWTYHQLYDDLLMFPAMIALYRIARGGASPPGPTSVVAGLLLTAALMGQLAPGRLHLYPYPWYLLYAVGEPLIWIAALLFLVVYSQRSLPRPAPAGVAACA
jgi:hypothetical protein